MVLVVLVVLVIYLVLLEVSVVLILKELLLSGVDGVWVELVQLVK
tara:strand:- start:499 stop:633 length:135 start_codon:yes stop_codon:yes gene_type:complete